jgi:hypothetical protein
VIKTHVGAVVVAAAAASALWIAYPSAQESQFAAGRNLAAEAAAARKQSEEKTPIPRLSNGKPNFSGAWRPSGIGATYAYEEHLAGIGTASEGPSIIVDPPDGILPYQPWALAERERRRRPESAYEENVAKCTLPGMPRMMVYNLYISQSLDKVVIFHETHLATRIIRFDNRPPLPETVRLWMGDHRGRWDGDTLVVETTNLNGQAWGNLGGDIFSDAAHIVERFRMVNATTMWWEATITDPKVYTRPWTMRFPAPHVKRGSDPDESNFDFEDSCHEGNADLRHLKSLHDAALESAARGPVAATPPPASRPPAVSPAPSAAAGIPVAIRSDFSGKWEISGAKSSPGAIGNGARVTFASELIISQQPAELHVDMRYPRTDPVIAVYKLDGSEITVGTHAGITETARVTPDGDKLIITARRVVASAFGDFVTDTKEVWTRNGNVLTIVKTATSAGASATETAVFEREP